MENVHIRIRQLRKDNKLTQPQFSKILNCDRFRVADIERAKSSPALHDIQLLSKHFNISTDYLLGLSEVRSVDPNIKMICDYTGLSENCVEILHKRLCQLEKHQQKAEEVKEEFQTAKETIGEYYDDEYGYSLGGYEHALDTAIDETAKYENFFLLISSLIQHKYVRPFADAFAKSMELHNDLKDFEYKTPYDDELFRCMKALSRIIEDND